MYFSIIPFSHSIGIEPLLYIGEGIIENDIQVGSVVEIPYGNNIENGIVTKIYTDSPIDIQSEAHTRIKKIIRIITTRIILAPYQIDMICTISARYMISIHRVLAIFLPRPLLTRLERKNYEQLENSKKPITSSQQKKLHITQNTIVNPKIVDTYIT
jgi:primosomal protein N'